MGKTALSKHMKSQKHISLMQARSGQSSSLLASWTQSQPRGTRPCSSTSTQDSASYNEHGLDNSASSSNQNIEVADAPSNSSGEQLSVGNRSIIGNWASSQAVMKAEMPQEQR